MRQPACILVAGEYKPGDPAPSGYLAWHEWAEVQHKSGLRQRACATCSRWRFPQELSAEVVRGEAVIVEGRRLVTVATESPVCLECAGRAATAEGAEA